jgi:hypothetical protein
LVDGEGEGRFVHQMGRFGGWRGRKDGSSTKWGVLVDGEGEVAGEAGSGRGSGMTKARSATKRKIVEKTLQGW